jgi:hypothetical protein
MSLINDALKKAQQLQTQGQAHSTGSTGSPQASSGQAPSNPGVTPNAPVVTDSPQASSGGDRSMPGQIFMLLAFGAGALIAVSVLATVYLLRRPAAPVVVQAPAVLSPTVAATSVGAQAPAAPALPVLHSPEPFRQAQGPEPVEGPVERGEGGGSPAVSLPAPSLPAVSLSNPSNGPVAPEKPTPVPSINAPTLALPQTIPPPTPGEIIAPISAPAIAKLPAPPPATVTAPITAPTLSPPAGPALLDPSKPDPKILAYIDALQIAGIRVSDTGSKVLMNDRVFRENEIVDHLLGLRLKKVESDTLTFVDERGVIYTKNF